MTNESYIIGDITNGTGNVTIGKNITVNTSNKSSGFDASTQKLIDEIKKLGLPSEKEAEIEETVQAINKLVTSDKQNKTMLTGLLGGLNATIDTLSKTSGLLTAFEAWKQFFS
ncbi:hypothetical protein [Brevibacillus laterosporus]|uniref:hypothetical protein n=1 Tax=Brevibacillus laterosporus TaxID=1465 RepID=UPI001315475B|nr:hypothetical protein [Brevibacillus laterosporus]NKQ18455.1 hypothetical protein [Brevibacillus laterosporus]WNX33224.1 hypothetical protein RWW94_10695 [Brevibacillus laterosporus]